MLRTFLFWTFSLTWTWCTGCRAGCCGSAASAGLSPSGSERWTGWPPAASWRRRSSWSGIRTSSCRPGDPTGARRRTGAATLSAAGWSWPWWRRGKTRCWRHQLGEGWTFLINSGVNIKNKFFYPILFFYAGNLNPPGTIGISMWPRNLGRAIFLIRSPNHGLLRQD